MPARRSRGAKLVEAAVEQAVGECNARSDGAVDCGEDGDHGIRLGHRVPSA